VKCSVRDLSTDSIAVRGPVPHVLVNVGLESDRSGSECCLVAVPTNKSSNVSQGSEPVVTKRIDYTVDTIGAGHSRHPCIVISHASSPCSMVGKSTWLVSIIPA
jgi:hypothetical protein